jgi:DNA processing protein
MSHQPHTRYYLGFNLVPGIGPTRLARLIEHCGSVEAAWHASNADLLAAGLDARSSTGLNRIRDTVDLDAELTRLEQQAIQVVTLEDDHYPRLLREIATAPPMLYVRGTLEPVDDWAIAVVGTRSPTTYGKEVARQIVGDLARSGVTIISGLAVGIDTVAHTAALEAGGRTLAVLGCGLDTIYPERNRPLAGQLIEQGALISDYPLGTRPLAANFPPRNRIISGLALGVLVVEAGEKSGALITVEFALEQGRDVFAVPGSIFNRTSKGTHQLIRQGAALVSGAADILEELNLRAVQTQQEVAAALPDDPTEAALLEQLSGEPQHIDTLVRAAQLSVEVVSATLTMLELKGLARQVGHMEYVRAR